MNGVKGRFLKKLKSIPQQLPHHRFSLSTHSQDAPHLSYHHHHHYHRDEDHGPSSLPRCTTNTNTNTNTTTNNSNKNEEKENIDPQLKPTEANTNTNTTTSTKRDRDADSPPDLNVSSFRRPRLNSSTLFDPDLLEAFHRAVADFHRARAASIELSRGPYDPLSRFEDRCPPGGHEAVVVYTTSLRGIRKTFEDCSRVRHLLSGLRVRFYERDVAVDAGLREELWRVLGGRVIPPRVFVKGRYIGGAEDVVALHEMGELTPILEGVRRRDGGAEECGYCGGMLFVVCGECGGGRKVYKEGEGRVRCGRCNENGLVACTCCCG